jgi:hypothetical protein
MKMLRPLRLGYAAGESISPVIQTYGIFKAEGLSRPKMVSIAGLKPRSSITA